MAKPPHLPQLETWKSHRKLIKETTRRMKNIIFCLKRITGSKKKKWPSAKPQGGQKTNALQEFAPSAEFFVLQWKNVGSAAPSSVVLRPCPQSWQLPQSKSEALCRYRAREPFLEAGQECLQASPHHTIGALPPLALCCSLLA